MYDTIITFADGTDLFVPNVLAESPEQVTDAILAMSFVQPVMKVVVIENGTK